MLEGATKKLPVAIREVTGNLRFPLDKTYHGCPRNSPYAAIAPMRLADSPAQRIIALWNGYQMDMVRHQAVGPDDNRAFFAPFSQQGNVRQIIVISEEGLQPPVTALSNVVRDA